MKHTLTLFTSTKPFINPHIIKIQRNALRSWVALGTEVDVMAFGDEVGLAEECARLGIRHFPRVKRNAQGTPLLSDLFQQAHELSDSPVLAYLNADIVALPEFLEGARRLQMLKQPYLVVGQRHDLEVSEEFDYAEGWGKRLWELAQTKGNLHVPTGSDYFIFPRGCYEKIPDFALGRSAWDNWMIYHARRMGWLAIDATHDIHIIHQNHDYHHLPGGKPHYHLPESDENVRLAGGKRCIFTIPDASHMLWEGKVKPAPRTWRKFWREVEIFPLVRLGSGALGGLFFTLFHPVQTFNEFRGWLYLKLKGEKK
jgi:hypothetical protein